MEQNVDARAPMTPVVDSKQKSGNGLKIVTAIACVVAVCGIGFGVYGMMQSSGKDGQISDLKAQSSDKDGQISDLKTQIEKLETVDPINNNGIISTDTTIIEDDNNDSFAANVLKSIKNLNGSKFGFKSSNFGNGIVYAYINSDGSLILENNEKHDIASDVIFADFLFEGNGGAPSLYFIREDGSVGVIKNVTYDINNPVVEEVSSNQKAVSVKNVTTRFGHEVVIVDVDGNFIDL